MLSRWCNSIPDSSGNIGRNFWREVDNYRTDIFWSYFESDRETMATLCMEKTGDIEHRFNAWKVSIRK